MKLQCMAGAAAAALFSSLVFGQSVPSGTVVATSKDAAGEVAWAQLAGSLQSAPSEQAPAAATTALRAKAQQAKDFYTHFGQHPYANEARKLEVLLMMDAARSGDTEAQSQVPTLVQTFRSDSSIPSSQRAIVAGAYDFGAAISAGGTQADLTRNYEAVARHLIQEFPDQPQGYVSLLTVASMHDDAGARALANEVATATEAPADTRMHAAAFVTRLDLVGAAAKDVFSGAAAEGKAKLNWSAGKPAIVYFWSAQNPASLAIASGLSARQTPALLMGICLDDDGAAAVKVAKARKLRGQLLYPGGLTQSNLAKRLGADLTPLVFLVDGNGKISDVRGAEDLEAKLANRGL